MTLERDIMDTWASTDFKSTYAEVPEEVIEAAVAEMFDKNGAVHVDPAVVDPMSIAAWLGVLAAGAELTAALIKAYREWKALQREQTEDASVTITEEGGEVIFDFDDETRKRFEHLSDEQIEQIKRIAAKKVERS